MAYCISKNGVILRSVCLALICGWLFGNGVAVTKAQVALSGDDSLYQEEGDDELLDESVDYTHPPPSRTPTRKLSAGLFYGHLIAKDDDKFRIVVQGLAPNQGRRVFYLDGKTRYFIEQEKASFSKIPLLARIAVRYFGEDEINVAKHVFRVLGVYKSHNYILKPASKKKAEAKKEGGAH